MLTLTLLLATIVVAVAQASRFPHDRMLTEPERVELRTKVHPASGSVSTYRGKSASYWAARYRARTRQLAHAQAALKHEWHPTVTYALRLASAVFRVPYRELATVSYCESTHNPYATNGRYRGLFQLSWSPFGFSPFDPVASALSAAQTVRREGWRRWECKP